MSESLFARIHGKDVYIKKLSALTFEILIDGRPIEVQIGHPRSLFTLIEVAMEEATPQTSLNLPR